MNAPLRRARTEAESALAGAFDAVAALLPGQGKVAALRAEAAARFAALGLPSRRVEAWHYSDLRARMKDALPLAGQPDAGAIAQARALLAPAKEGCARAVLVDGYFIEELSCGLATRGLLVRSLDDALQDRGSAAADMLSQSDLGRDDAVFALNAAFMRGGVEIVVEPGFRAAHPVELVSIIVADEPKAVFSRSLLSAGADSAIVLSEQHLTTGDARVQKNDALVVFAGGRSRIEHAVHRPRAPQNELHVHSFILHLQDSAKFNGVALIEGGGFLRRQIFARFEGEEAELSFSGAALLRGQDHADTTLVVDHAHPHNTSREYFKHILDDSATGVFQGKVVVAPHAQKTDGVMKSQTILLGQDVAMYNKPELEIFADDVACGHGATVGGLDPSQLFYAMARGIPRADAETLLLEAFAGDAIERLGDETLREKMLDCVRAWLKGRAA